MLTCTLVSFFHGSNDGQKGMGLMMLILVGLVPAAFAVNMANDVALEATVADMRNWPTPSPRWPTAPRYGWTMRSPS